ncbi:hypothetical protein TSMEX_000134 [Taenia solium]|eukprot:TsM_000785600 transcript=TsM_000785600 gene=TsM_000785600
MGTYTPPTHTTSHPMGRGVGGSDFWQSGQTTSLKPDPSSTSTTATTPSSSSSSSLYAAVMAAAVASWSGQSASTATPATDTLATGVPTSRNDPYSKTNFSSCCEDVAIKRTKSQDAAKTPYSPSSVVVENEIGVVARKAQLYWSIFSSSSFSPSYKVFNEALITALFVVAACLEC